MEFRTNITVGPATIAEGSSAYIIAEAGVNHGGSLGRARQLIDIAAASGANAVKFQTFKTERLILKRVAKAPYQQRRTDASESQAEMLKKLELRIRDFVGLQKYCRSKGITFLTTPFDEESLDDLDRLNLPAYKVASTDITNLPFLRRVARKKKPIFLSSGMAYLEEVRAALEEIAPYNRDVVLMQCTANYPIANTEANLRVIETYRREFRMLVGYSDHTVGVGASPYAVAMGAVLVEKHFTQSHDLEGPDHTASLEPQELRDYVAAVRNAESYLGRSQKSPELCELSTRASLTKFLVAFRRIAKGELFSEKNVAAKRTGGAGIPPTFWRDVAGKKASRAFDVDEVIEL